MTKIIGNAGSTFKDGSIKTASVFYLFQKDTGDRFEVCVINNELKTLLRNTFKKGMFLKVDGIVCEFPNKKKKIFLNLKHHSIEYLA